MLKKSVYIIGLFSLLAVIACSSGTVDPNANPLAYAYESSSSMGEQSISSSAMSSSLDTTNKNLESSPNTVHIIKDDTVFVVVNTDAGIAVHLDIDTLYPRLEFSTEATHQYSIAIGNKKGVMDSNDGQVAVYEKEQGATAICDNNENKYFAKFKLGQNNHIEKTIELKNYGSACDSILVSFEESCKFAKSKEGIVGACDKDGNLEAYCSYVDESADFDTLLREFTEEVEKICEEGHCQINKTN